ncbi:MAG: (d)CMP kinase [Deferribacteraceae bacterium]|jgi:cytidylate kinase|nr:(d)CMP kinase [Deferribacteraceae bacterium]
MQVAIDGPASSGKSTISKIAAERFSLAYIDTGAMYRAAAYIKLKYVVEGAAFYTLLQQTEFTFNPKNTPFLICAPQIGEVDISSAIRTLEVTKAVSYVASDAEVRRILTAKQQWAAKGRDVIMDGRDIGTVVLPNADLKFFLIAAAEVRAKRRCDEWIAQGKQVLYEDVLKDILARDTADIHRDAAPLKKAPDAREIDTSLLTIEEVVEIISVCISQLRLG